MLHIGCHLSASKGYYAMGKTALSSARIRSSSSRETRAAAAQSRLI